MKLWWPIAQVGKVLELFWPLIVTAGFLVFFIFKLANATKDPDHVFQSDGTEVDCKGKQWDQCVAANCRHDYETIQWRDFGGSCTYRCKP